MWPFKKRNIGSNLTPVKTILCIPVSWEDKMEIFVKTNGDYMVVTNILMDIKNGRNYTFEATFFDAKMENAFKYAGRGSGVSDEFLKEIAAHKSVIYISCETGNIDAVKNLAEIGSVLLSTGGIGIKVETTGIAFEKDKWISLVNKGDINSWYNLFVVGTIKSKDGTVLSCGMHNLGYSDVIISNQEYKKAYEIITTFNFYQLVDKPTIKDGQTFKTAINSPFYRIRNELNQPFKGDELLENPFGVFRLIQE